MSNKSFPVAPDLARITMAAGAIIDVMTGGKFDWRSRLEESDFLESADWLTACEYARATLRSQRDLIEEAAKVGDVVAARTVFNSTSAPEQPGRYYLAEEVRHAVSSAIRALSTSTPSPKVEQNEAGVIERLALNLRAYAHSRGAPQTETDEEAALDAARRILPALDANLMASMSEHHQPKAGVTGKCSVPMWMGGLPSGFCDEPAYGQQYAAGSKWAPPHWSPRDRNGYWIDPNRVPPFATGLCCKAHGGPGESDIRFMRDGNMWCGFEPGFENLQESIAGFGLTQQAAFDDLKANVASAAGGNGELGDSDWTDGPPFNGAGDRYAAGNTQEPNEAKLREVLIAVLDTSGARGTYHALRHSEAVDRAEAALASPSRGDLPSDVERVARAISLHTFANTKCGPATDCAEWDEMTDYDRTTYRRAARAAIAALGVSTPSPVTEREKIAVEALRSARAALHKHYVDWDGEPEDAVPLQLARAECDAALASLEGTGK